MRLEEGLIAATAWLSDDERYRYQLTRRWGHASPLTFIMLNPSTADADTDDLTLRKCQHYARDWGFGGVIIVNLFALRATDPAELAHAADPVGPLNDAMLVDAISNPYTTLVAAWGAKGGFLGRDALVTEMVRQTGGLLYRIGPPTALRKMPKHPGRLSYSLTLERHA